MVDSTRFPVPSERLEALLETSPVGVLAGDIHGGICYANEAALRMLGVAREEVRQGRLRWNAITPPECAEADARAVQELTQQRLCRPYEKVFIARDGRRVPVLIGCMAADDRPIEDALLVAFVVDLTVQKAAQAELLLRERMLEAMAFSAQRLLRSADPLEHIEAILEKLGCALDADRVYVFENHVDETGALLTSQRYEWVRPGVPPQLHNPALQRFPYVAGGFARWVETLRRGEPIVGDVSQFPASEQHVLASQQIVSILVVPIFCGDHWWGFMGFDSLAPRRWSSAELDALRAAADNFGTALQRTRAQEALERLELAVRSTTDAIAIVDPCETVRYANDAFCRMFGCADPTREPIGLSQAIDARELTALLHTTLATGRPWRGRLQVRGRDAKAIDVDATLTPIRPSDGRSVHAVLVLRDVTAQIEIETQLRQAQKMEAVGQLAGGIAHDFNNLLQVITGYGQLLLQRLGDQRREADDVREMLHAAECAQQLVRQLLIFSRRERVYPRRLNPNDVIANVMKMLRRIIGEHIDLSFEPDPSSDIVFADAGQIEQIVLNLCVNARDAIEAREDSAGAGRICIRTAPAALDREFCRRRPGARPGRYVLLQVSDSGVGIPPDHLERLFEPFFTTKDVGRGTGLGLATVYGIVKQLEGFIDVVSRPGEGSTFSIYLPVAGEESEPAEPSDAPVDGAPIGDDATILLAEDDELVRHLTVKILQQAGYRVLVARDGAEALRVFEQHRDRIALALLDAVMPALNGFGVLRALRAARPGLPAIIATGYGSLAAEPGPIGGDDPVPMLAKPFTPELLLRRIRELLAGQR